MAKLLSFVPGVTAPTLSNRTAPPGAAEVVAFESKDDRATRKAFDERGERMLRQYALERRRNEGDGAGSPPDDAL